MRALHYITGDTQQTGFRRIGGSPSFPADQLPYLNNGEPIPEQARIASGNYSQGGKGIRQLSHVWEYQAGDYGKPVLINSIVAIGSARQHGFSEYVLGETNNAAEEAEPWQLIRNAEQRTHWLDMQTFMAIPGRDEIPCEDEIWNPEDILDSPCFGHAVDDTWKLTVLSHYWKQASVRAFSENPPTTVRVNLGTFSEEDSLEDNKKTIEQAKLFFADIIVRGLPKQVQNIASVSAGVNGADTVNLYTALEFDVSLNMYEEETLRLDRPRDLRAYRLTEGELQFIREASEGKTPAVVQEFFARYKQLTDHEYDGTSELNTPFMADYRVWYGLYCMDRIIKEGHAFIKDSGLMNEFEHGKVKIVKDARACFTLMRQMHKLLEKEHRLGEIRRALAVELLEPLETRLLKFMLDDMNRDDAEPFLLNRNEMIDFHHRMLYYAPDSQQDLMTGLAVRDQQVSRTPQFVRCYPSVPIRNENADIRNAKALGALLAGVIRPIIEAEKNSEKIENKYLNELRSEEFALKWALPNDKTKAAVAGFLREEIRDPGKHFLLYGVSKVYLPLDELLNVTLQHFTENNTSRDSLPNERQRKIAEDGCREYISDVGNEKPECLDNLNRYYQACFRSLRGNIGAVEGMVRQFGGNTSGAMKLIFDEAAEVGEQMRPEEAKAVFETFGGKDARFSHDEQVAKAYRDMIVSQCGKKLEVTGEELETNRENLVPWIADMVEAAPFPTDVSECVSAIFESAGEGTRISLTAADGIFKRLMPNAKRGSDQVRRAFTDMLKNQLDVSLERKDSDILKWLNGMANVSDDSITLDTTEMMKKVFEAGKQGERMKASEAGAVFKALEKKAENMPAVLHAYADMLSARRDEARINRDEDTFDWLCRMEDITGNDEWLGEQHAADIGLLCDISRKTGNAVNTAFLSTIQTWLEQGSVPAKGITQLQRYCNSRLEQGEEDAANRFMLFFDRLESDCNALREVLFSNTVRHLQDDLKKKSGSFGSMVAECITDTVKAGKRPEDLYEEVKPEVTEHLQNRFRDTTDLRILIEELDRIPPNTGFYQAWQDMLGEQISDQQVELFNRQPSIERLLDLKKNVLQRCQRCHDSLAAAYELIEGYGNRMRKLSEASEYEAVTNMGKQLSEINSMLDRAGEVRKTLCTAIRNENWPEIRQAEQKSFRHMLCSRVIQATLTDETKTVMTEMGSSNGCPEWSRILGSLFTHAELDEATRKPYAKKSLPTLRKLLSTLETVRMMTNYEMDPSWGEELVRMIHSNSELHRYQSALARNREMCERYQLSFDTDGLEYKMRT